MSWLIKTQWCYTVWIYSCFNFLLGLDLGSHSGDNGDEDPPVPIPNTEVKLVYGEST